MKNKTWHKMSESQKKNTKLHDKQCKPVICIETGKIYKSAKEAGILLGSTAKYTPGGHISECCRGKREIAFGFHWEYLKEDKIE